MARIRTIKPEFWESEKVARLPALDALTFMGLISLADDEGIGRAEVRGVFGRCHAMRPGVSFRVLRGVFKRLERVGLVTFYDGPNACSYYWIHGFSEHQKIDRPSPSKFPKPPNFVERSTNDPRTLDDDSLLDQGSGIREGKGSGTRRDGSPKSRRAGGLKPNSQLLEEAAKEGDAREREASTG